MNEREFEEIYRALAPRLRRYLLRLCGTDAEELVQETFFRYLRAKYSAEAEERTKILFTIATNLARNRWSRRVEHVPLDGEHVAETYDRDAHLDLLRALEKLGPRDRALVWLAYAEGYEHRDIAKITGVGRASVRVLLYRAKRKLAALLEGPTNDR